MHVSLAIAVGPRFTCFLVAALVCLLLGGCGGETDSVTDTYQVRGQIVSLPVAGDPASGLRIHHEPIPTFVGDDGQMVGMDAMTMGFTPATGVSLDGLEEGDKGGVYAAGGLRGQSDRGGGF